MTSALNPLPRDKRDLKVGGIFGYPKLEDVPLQNFLVAIPKIKNQGNTYRCSGYASSTCIEPKEGVVISGDYIYGKAKELDGDTEDGTNLRTVCKVLYKTGAIEELEWKENLTDEELKRWYDWKDKYDYMAVKHRQKSYFYVDGKYDFFDNIRSALWKYKNERKLILTGTTWFNGWNNLAQIDEAIGQNVGGHALAVIGQRIINNESYLVIQNSYGKTVGDNGHQYFSRKVVNKYFQPYGAFTFIDLSQEELDNLLKDSKISLLERIINLLKDLLFYKKLNKTN